MTSPQIIPLARAKEEGLTRYFTGKPCKNGHIAPRFTSARKCVICQEEQTRVSARNPEAQSRRRLRRKANALSPEARAAEVERARQWRLANRERDNEWRRAYQQRKWREDNQWMLARALRSRLWWALKRSSKTKKASALGLVGCSVYELMQHLEAQFVPGMSWGNYGEWHIDHIRPCASFDLADLAEQKACFHYTNLQPLWAVDNLSKHAKWIND